jgi:hypothetical protein
MEPNGEKHAQHLVDHDADSNLFKTSIDAVPITVQRKTFLPPRGSQELAHAGMIAFAYE